MKKIKKGDNVIVLLGKDRNKKGTVERIITKDNKIAIAGINIYKRHVKGQQGAEGGVIDIVKPINLSNVALICPSCNKPTRVGFLIEGDTKVRVCKKCKAVIDKKGAKK